MKYWSLAIKEKKNLQDWSYGGWRIMSLILDCISKRSFTIEYFIGVGNEFGKYPHVLWIEGFIPNYKVWFGACPLILIENNTKMYHRIK